MKLEDVTDGLHLQAIAEAIEKDLASSIAAQVAFPDYEDAIRYALLQTFKPKPNGLDVILELLP